MSLKHKASKVKPQLTSFDNFLGGKLNIEQPIKGFRSGIDAVLLGASVNIEESINIESSINEGENKSAQAHLLELGAGAGVAALTALTHNKALSATLIDKHEEMTMLASSNIVKNAMSKRANVVNFDILSKPSEREKANIRVNYYEYVIANPPFFNVEEATKAKGELRSSARHMEKQHLDIWVKMASSCACAGGKVIFIYRSDGLSPILQSFEKRFGNIKILPIISRASQSAKKIMISGILGSNAPLEIKSPLILHGQRGRDFLPDIEAVFRGEKLLYW